VQSLKFVKSPLRYPGGKSRAVNAIYKYIEPLGVKTLCSPFFGGGSLEIYCAQNGIQVFGYDSFESLVDFWQELLDNPQRLADKVATFKPGKFTKDKFQKLQKSHLDTDDPFMKAVEFYVLNRTSYSGSTLSGGMANYKGINPRFTESSIERIRNFKIKNKKLTVEKLDFKKSIKEHEKDLLYLDPPYKIKSNLYGNRGELQKHFDHEALADSLEKPRKWILSYNESKYIRTLYDGYQILEPEEWSYGMSKDKKSREILIFGKDMPDIKSK